MYHSKEYIDTVCSTKDMTLEQLKEISQKYDGVYFNNVSYLSYED